MPSSSSPKRSAESRPRKARTLTDAAKIAAPAAKPPPAAPLKRFLVRCTFVGEQKKQKLEGSFRFVCEATDAAAVLARLEPAVNKLRRTGELPPRCDVYVEFVLELADLSRGVVADFERWESEPKRFQHGCIAFSDACSVYHHERTEPAFRFGKPAA